MDDPSSLTTTYCSFIIGTLDINSSQGDLIQHPLICSCNSLLNKKIIVQKSDKSLLSVLYAIDAIKEECCCI